jgi:nucleotide-binding universal stress UspA family protein
VVLPFGGEWTGFRQASSGQIDSARFKVTSWADRIRENGVVAEAIVSNGKVNTAEAIVNYAESGSFGILALAAQSGLLATTLFGSTARQVARESPCLTLLLRNPASED